VDSFSLVDEPWVIVLTDEDATETVSLLELFRRAHEIREVVGDLPTQGFAILRLALAVFARAFGGPPTRKAWESLWAQNRPDPRPVEEYLARHRDRFDLFHPRTPFFQTAGLRTAKGGFSGLERLVADIPAGAQYFTTRAGRGLERLDAAEAARWLVHLQAYDPSGIKSGALGDPRVKGGKGYPIGVGFAGNLGGLWVDGGDLWRTLLLNSPPWDQRGVQRDREDRPAWEATPPTPAEADDVDDRPYGPLDLYTWQSRRVLLHRDGDQVDGVLVTNGDKLTPQNLHRREPLTAWRKSEAQARKLGGVVYMPREHRPGHALWRGLATLLPLSAPRGRAESGPPALTAAVVEWAGEVLGVRETVALRTAGMVYGVQSSIVLDVVEDRVMLPAALLGAQRRDLAACVVEAVAATENAVRAVGRLATDLARAGGARESATTDGARDELERLAYADLDAAFRRWLVELGPDVDLDTRLTAWHHEAAGRLVRLAAEAVRAAGPVAWVGREVNGRHLSTPQAEARFRAELRRALPLSVTEEVA